jgi:adenylate kinase
VIVVTGTPGVGKTVCSRLLAGELSTRLVDLGGLVEEKNLVLDIDGERDTIIADIDGLASYLDRLLKRESRDCIVEGHLAPHVLDRTHIELAYVLRCDPDELISRLKERGYSKSKAFENAASEILGICLWEAVDRFGDDKVVEIDTTSCYPEQVVKEMIDILDGSSSRVVGRIDWLSKISEQERLGFFFR